jgi:transglutaminase-like putative cysteine protease
MTLQLDEPAEFALAVAAASPALLASETLTVRREDRPLEVQEVAESALTRLCLFEADAGILTIDYSAQLLGRAQPAPVHVLDALVALRPSRYVQSDALVAFARDTFSVRGAAALVREVSRWVYERLDYVPEATSPVGGAVETLESGQGVCRDYAHLTAALLRALDVPARLVSVYAPELSPMDFHAVVEAVVDGRWVVVDSTRLAPRASMVRVATGRDAADTAFLTNHRSDIQLLSLDVDAVSSESFDDDPDELVVLG